MPITADSYVIELEARVGRFDNPIRQSARTFDQSMSQVERAATQAEAQVRKSSDGISRSNALVLNSSRNLGFQIQDIGTQLASGTSPFIVLAQQGPQVANALDGASGAAGRMATFLSGPWGAALFAATTILGMLAMKLFDAGEAHDAAKQAADAQREAEQMLNDVLQGTVDLSERARIAALDLAKARTYEARATLNAAKAQLALAQAYLDSQRARTVGEQGVEQRAIGLATGQGQATVADRQFQLDQAQTALNAAEIRLKNLERAATMARGIEAEREAEKGRSAAEAARRRAEAEARRREREAEAAARERLQADQELVRSRLELADAEGALTADTRIQDEILRERIRQERDLAIRQIEADPDRSKAFKEEMAGIERRIADARIRKVNMDEAQRFLEEEVALRRGQIETERDILQGEADIAVSSQRRRDIALRLLDLSIQLEQAQLEAVLASKKSTDVEKQIAQARLNALGQIRNNAATRISRENAGPLDRYRQELSGELTDANEALEEIEVRALRALEDSAVRAAKKLLGVKGVLGDILGELIRIGIQRQFLAPAADFLFGPAGSGAGGGLVGGIISGLAAGFGIPGAASGYSGTIGGRGGIDRNILSINGRPMLRVSRGEQLAVVPQGRALGAAGGMAATPRPQITVLAPQQFDLRGVVMTPDLVRQMDARNRTYADQVGVAVLRAAVKAAPGRVAQFQQDGR